MPLSEYARSEYEEDSEFVMSEEEDHGELHSPGHGPTLNSPRAEIPRLEILDDSLSNPSLNSPNGNHANRSINNSVVSDSNSLNFINHVDQVMNQVKTLEADTRWSRVLKHRTGVQVFAQNHAKALGKDKVLPIFKGVGLIRGYSPPSVFAVIGSSKLWDEWYEDGNLVENLSNQISLTYMCMKAGLGTRTRDLSLVEKVEATPDGSIYFCASSVDTPRIPVIPGRIRAHINLNAWVLQPFTLPPTTSGAAITATKVTYYLQVNIKTFVAEAITKRYLARRPLCITKIESYLQKYGSPSVQVEDGSEAYPHQGGFRKSYSRNYMSVKQIEFPRELSGDHNSTTSAPNTLMSRKIRSHISSIGSFGQKSRHRLPSSAPSPSFILNDLNNRRPSTTIQSEQVSANGSPNGLNQTLLMDHLKPNEECLNWNSMNQAYESFNAYLIDLGRNPKDWQTAGISANSVQMLLNSQISRPTDHKWEESSLFKMPIIKSEVILNTREDGFDTHPITKEQVLLTILSNLAKRVWNQNFHGQSKSGSPTEQHQLLLSTDNGFDQGTYLGNMRAVYPHIPDDSFFCFDQMIVRPSHSSTLSENKSSVDDSKIIVIHHSIENEEGYLDQLDKKFQFYHLSPKVVSTLREKIERKVLSKIDVEAWCIQSHSVGEGLRDQIRILHLSALQLNLKNQRKQPLQSSTAINSDVPLAPNPLPEFLTKLISSSIASRPHQVCEFIREFGFAPGFVKWMDGQIEYLGDHDYQINEDDTNNSPFSDGIKSGQVEWRFTWGKNQNSINRSTEASPLEVSSAPTQICWFQWSEQMYPNGIEITLDPLDAADVRLASDTYNTIQFNWKKVENPLSDGIIKLKAKRIESTVDGKLDRSSQQQVIFNGNRLIETVALRVVHPKKKKKTSGDVNGDSNNDQAHSTHNNQLKQSTRKPQSSSSQPSPVDGQYTSITPLPESSKITNTGTQNDDKSKNNDKNEKEKQVLLVDPNVAIIINQHLYFTRPQVLFFLFCTGCAYIYGRFG